MFRTRLYGTTSRENYIASIIRLSIKTDRDIVEIKEYLYTHNAVVVYKINESRPEGVYGYTECDSIHKKGNGIYLECINLTGCRSFTKLIINKIHELLETCDYVVTIKHTKDGPQEVIWEK